MSDGVLPASRSRAVVCRRCVFGVAFFASGRWP